MIGTTQDWYNFTYARKSKSFNECILFIITPSVRKSFTVYVEVLFLLKEHAKIFIVVRNCTGLSPILNRNVCSVRLSANRFSRSRYCSQRRCIIFTVATPNRVMGHVYPCWGVLWIGNITALEHNGGSTDISAQTNNVLHPTSYIMVNRLCRMQIRL